MIARVSAACLVAASVASVASAEPAHKPLPDKYEKAAGQMFARAAAADARGDHDQARALYRKAFELVPHASIAFNIAELDVELHDLDDAVVNYDLYLALEPDAADRAAIAATIAKLEQRPATIMVEPSHADRWDPIDFAVAYVLVDGAIVHSPGPATVVPIRTAPGRHEVDVVSSLTNYNAPAVLRIGGRERLAVHAPLRIDGGVVLSAHGGIKLFLDGAGIDGTHRVVTRPGARRVAVQDGGRECPPLTLEVPRDGNAIAYLYVAPADLVVRSGCRALHVEHHRLVFKP